MLNFHENRPLLKIANLPNLNYIEKVRLMDYFVSSAGIVIYEKFKTWLQAVILQTVWCFYGSAESGTRLEQKTKSYRASGE